jgi:putative oxidoreductase
MRLVVGCSLIANGIEKFQADDPLESIVLNLLAVGDGMLLAVGLWTPIAGSLLPILAIGGALAQRASWCPLVLVSTMGVGLALVGPGAWSLDAWLFGWKRIDIEQ